MQILHENWYIDVFMGNDQSSDVSFHVISIFFSLR